MKPTHSGTIASFLKRHPRLLGALFALAVLLTQAAPVLAECNTSTCSGP
jgi:hypothetical protein